VEEINESITVGNGKIMMATKVGSLKCRDIQLDGSRLDITLHEVKFVLELVRRNGMHKHSVSLYSVSIL
jgi:hypothetical protein